MSSLAADARNLYVKHARWKSAVGRIGRLADREAFRGLEIDMRFRIEVNTLDGKLSYQRETAADALAVAEGGRQSLGVTITDTASGEVYDVDEFRTRFERPQ